MSELRYYKDFLESTVIKVNNGDFGIILILSKNGHPYVKIIYRDKDNNISSVFLTLFGYEYAFNTYKRFFDKTKKQEVVQWLDEHKDNIKEIVKERYSKLLIEEIVYD